MRRRDNELGTRSRAKKRRDAPGYRAAGRDHVVYDQAGAVRDIPNDLRYLGPVGALAPLVQHDNRKAEALGVIGGEPRASGIR